jgi:hypothetical protein
MPRLQVYFDFVERASGQTHQKVFELYAEQYDSRIEPPKWHEAPLDQAPKGFLRRPEKRRRASDVERGTIEGVLLLALAGLLLRGVLADRGAHRYRGLSSRIESSRRMAQRIICETATSRFNASFASAHFSISEIRIGIRSSFRMRAFFIASPPVDY